MTTRARSFLDPCGRDSTHRRTPTATHRIVCSTCALAHWCEAVPPDQACGRFASSLPPPRTPWHCESRRPQAGSGWGIPCDPPTMTAGSHGRIRRALTLRSQALTTSGWLWRRTNGSPWPMVTRSSNGWRPGRSLGPTWTAPNWPASTSSRNKLSALTHSWPSTDAPGPRCRRTPDVVIEGDHDRVARDQLAARFAVFHLLVAAAPDSDAAVGARGLTGHAYDGHVFWDADVFVLPALAAIRPASTRHARVPHPPSPRCPTARPGAWPCWRPLSLGVGRRRAATSPPSQVREPRGAMIPIATGAREEHIVADVAWAAAQYAAGRETTRSRRGRVAISRGDGPLLGQPDQRDPDGHGTSRRCHGSRRVPRGRRRQRVHERDGALEPSSGRRSADPNDGDPEEAARLRALADCLVDGWDPGAGSTSSSPATSISSPC